MTEPSTPPKAGTKEETSQQAEDLVALLVYGAELQIDRAILS